MITDVNSEDCLVQKANTSTASRCGAGHRQDKTALGQAFHLNILRGFGGALLL